MLLQGVSGFMLGVGFEWHKLRAPFCRGRMEAGRSRAGVRGFTCCGWQLLLLLFNV